MTQLHRTNDAHIQGLADLLESQYSQSTFFRGDKTARLFIELMAKRYVEQAEGGDVCLYYWDGHVLVGAIFRYPKKFVQFGAEGDELVIALAPCHRSAMEWATETVLSLQWSPKRVTVGQLSIAHQALIPVLYRVGLGIDALGLIGDTAQAHRQLRDRHTDENPLKTLGLTLERLDAERLDDVAALRSRTFAAEPEYCWFGANPGHLEMHRARLAVEVQKDHAWFVLCKGKELVGHFGSSITYNHPLWGTVGGFEVYFDEDFRNKGLGRLAYEHTLAALLECGAKTFKGNTAQPPIMHLGKLMGRKLFEIHLKHAPFFDAEHFAAYLNLQDLETKSL